MEQGSHSIVARRSCEPAIRLCFAWITRLRTQRRSEKRHCCQLPPHDPPSAFYPFMSAGLIPYSPHGEEPRHSEKALAKPRNPRRIVPMCSRSARRWRNCSIPRSTAAMPAWVRAPDCSRRRIIRRTAAPAARPRCIARGPRRAEPATMWRRSDATSSSPPPARTRAGRGRGWGVRGITDAAAPADRPPTPDPSPPAQVRGGRGEEGFGESPQREFAPANYGTAATIPTLDPELAKQLGFTTEEEDLAAMARAAAQQDGSARRRRHRGRAGKPDPRRPARIQGRGRPGENLDAASPAAPGKIRRRRALRDQVRIRAEGRPAAPRSRNWSRASRATTAPRCCSASPEPARRTPWPR